MLSSYDLWNLTELIQNLLIEKWKLMTILFFAILYFFHMMTKPCPSMSSNKRGLCPCKVLISLKFCQSSLSTHTERLCCVNKNQFFNWRQKLEIFVFLLHGKQHLYCQKPLHIRRWQILIWVVSIRQIDENKGKNWASEIMPGQGHSSSSSMGKSDRLLLTFQWH